MVWRCSHVEARLFRFTGRDSARAKGPAARLLMNTVMQKLTPGTYQLTASRGGDAVLRHRFDNLDEANEAVADALVRYRDCEVRLSQGDGVLLSAGPAPSRRRPRSR
jgi:hypothetical protein